MVGEGMKMSVGQQEIIVPGYWSIICVILPTMFEKHLRLCCMPSMVSQYGPWGIQKALAESSLRHLQWLTGAGVDSMYYALPSAGKTQSRPNRELEQRDGHGTVYESTGPETEMANDNSALTTYSLWKPSCTDLPENLLTIFQPGHGVY
jgi:hypothetical protein